MLMVNDLVARLTACAQTCGTVQSSADEMKPVRGKD